MREVFAARPPVKPPVHDVFYTITKADVGCNSIRTSVGVILVSEVMGRVRPGDVGRRLVAVLSDDQTSTVWQAESQAQRIDRARKAEVIRGTCNDEDVNHHAHYWGDRKFHCGGEVGFAVNDRNRARSAEIDAANAGNMFTVNQGGPRYEVRPFLDTGSYSVYDVWRDRGTVHQRLTRADADAVVLAAITFNADLDPAEE